MFYIFLKYLLTAALVVFISEVAKRNDRLGSFIASLPLVTILTLIWLKIEKVSTKKISNHAYYTFWFAHLADVFSISEALPNVWTLDGSYC